MEALPWMVLLFTSMLIWVGGVKINTGNFSAKSGV